jgi:precorrin-4 C11-methyltransferase
MPTLFTHYDQLVCFLAAGAVTRLIAPCLAAKTSDPGVLVIDEAGRFVIPLLSGHKGGANAFARTVAGCLGATPVVTTASDVLGGLSLDLLEEAFGWIAEPADRLKLAAMSLVNGEPVAVIQEIGSPGSWLADMDLPPHVSVVVRATDLPPQPFAAVLWVADRVVEDPAPLDPARILWYRPRSLVLGVGCERGVSVEALDDGLEQFLRQQRIARASIAAIASLNLKEDEAGLVEWAARHGWPTFFYTPEELAATSGVANPSEVVAKCVGTPGVAEPAALRAAGVDQLLVEKQVIASVLSPRRMTFALARQAQFQVRGMGRVVFVGAGPGDPGLLTRKAYQALRHADVVVYAGSLIPEAVLREAPAGATLHNSAHLTLEQVMEVVLNAVRAGKNVVRLQSGDISLYSAIQEQIAVLEEQRIDYAVIPGISSFQAAAAALNSELTLPEVVQTVILTRGEGLTPMPAGETLKSLASHGATLCIFLSARLGSKIQEQLLTAYAPETPVAIVHRVTWPDEQIIVTQLDQLADQLRAHGFTRTTLILVGTAIGARRHRSRLYDNAHGHIFRASSRGENGPVA